MNQQELIDTLVAQTRQPKKIISDTLAALAHTASQTLALGGEVTLPGLGKLHVVDAAERVGRNPKTGEPITIPAAHRVKFSAGVGLKRIVNPQ